MGRGPAPEADTSEVAARYQTPTGEPCPRAVRLDGTVEGAGACLGCGYCLLLVPACWR